MLAIIDTDDGRCCYAEVVDGSYETISKMLEKIGRPELVTLEIIDKLPLEVDKRVDLYDWDDLAPFIQGETKMTSKDILESEDITPVASIQIMDSTYVWTDMY